MPSIKRTHTIDPRITPATLIILSQKNKQNILKSRMAYMILEKPLLFFLTIIVVLVPCSHGLMNNQTQSQSQRRLSLAPTPTNLINYHGGPLLTMSSAINVYLVWYGSFSLNDRTTINDFFASFKLTPFSRQGPTVSKWWETTQSYKDRAGKPVPSGVRVIKQIGDIYSLGKNIKRGQLANFIKSKIETKVLPLDSNGIYLFLTAKDVTVERFCMGSCGFHDKIMISRTSRVVFAHVGDPSVQCPGLCAWPYAVPAYGPPGQALAAPNGVGTDGMVMNIATVLAGAATNPFKNGYYQGDALAPLEAVTACSGIFGAGAYPGFPGNLMVDKVSKASFNAYGVNGRKFLLPSMWHLTSSTCRVVA